MPRANGITARFANAQAAIVNAALADLSAAFDTIYDAGVGRPSIPPERLLRALLLHALYGIRSERQIMERLEYDLLFCRFAGIGVDDAGGIRQRLAKPRPTVCRRRRAHVSRRGAGASADRPGRITLGAD